MDPPVQALAAIGSFSGEEGLAAHEWLRNITMVASVYHWTDPVCLMVARLRCVGAAALWLDSSNVRTWPEFQQQFLTRFGESTDTLLSRFEQCTQRQGEPVHSFHDRFLSLAVRAGRTTDPTLPHRFFRGLNRTLRKQLAPYKPVLNTIDSLLQAAQGTEKWDTAVSCDEPEPPQAPPAAYLSRPICL
jgi:hypothetical protein